MEPEFGNALEGLSKKLRPFIDEIIMLEKERRRRPFRLVLTVKLRVKGKRAFYKYKEPINPEILMEPTRSAHTGATRIQRMDRPTLNLPKISRGG